MNKPERRRNKRYITYIVMGIALMLGGINANAQTTEEEDDEFFSEISKENFKSDLGNDNDQRSIDYSSNPRNRRGEENYNIFGNDQQMPVYKFEEENPNINNNRNSNGVIIQGGGVMSNGSTPEAPNNANIPSVQDPFRQGQTGVKAPRNMDAVPDNGDEPNDVPLDGGVIVLGVAALSLGYKKLKKEIK